MADKTILDFPVLTDNLDADEMYVLRGTGTGRDRHQSRLDFLQDILLFGVPIWTITRSYLEDFGMAQDEGMTWQNSIAGVNIGNKPSTNQDKWNPVSAPIKELSVVASGVIILGYADWEIPVDLTGGNISISQLPIPNFIGQKLHIYGVGSGVGDVAAGTGIIATQFSENDSGLTITAISLTAWTLQDVPWRIGSTYIQFPGDSDPATVGLPGTWSNVSSELAGDFIRFEGGGASAFESGQQLATLYPHWHEQYRAAVSFSAGANQSDSMAAAATSLRGGGTGVKEVISDGVNPIPTLSIDNASVNRTVRKWRRTA